eukprot:gene2067-biopygen5678
MNQAGSDQERLNQAGSDQERLNQPEQLHRLDWLAQCKRLHWTDRRNELHWFASLHRVCAHRPPPASGRIRPGSGPIDPIESFDCTERGAGCWRAHQHDRLHWSNQPAQTDRSNRLYWFEPLLLPATRRGRVVGRGVRRGDRRRRRRGAVRNSCAERRAAARRVRCARRGSTAAAAAVRRACPGFAATAAGA